MLFLLGSMLFLSVSVSAARYYDPTVTFGDVFTECSKCGITIIRLDHTSVKNSIWDKAIMNRYGYFCPSCYEEDKPAGAPKATAAAAAQGHHAFSVGDEVQGLYKRRLYMGGREKEGKWYPATIHKVTDTGYGLKWDDGLFSNCANVKERGTPAQERVLQGSLLGKILSYTGHRNEGSASQLVCKEWNKTVRDNQAQYNVRKPSAPSKDRSIRENAWKLSEIPNFDILNIRPGDYVKYAGRETKVSSRPNFAKIYYTLSKFERNPDAELTSFQTGIESESWEENCVYRYWCAKYDHFDPRDRSGGHPGVNLLRNDGCQIQ